MSSDSTSNVPMALHAAREGDGYWKSKGEQWSLLCPHMSSTAKIALGLLCSLTGQTHPVRKLTAKELAAMLSKGPVSPGEAPKGMSAGGAIRVLRELADLGQITRPDGSRLTISSRATAELSICVWKRPRHECGCARNVHDALNVLRGEDCWFPPADAGQNSDQASEAGENSDQPGQNSDQPGQNSAKTLPPTCDDVSPLSLSSSSSSLSGAADDSGVTPAPGAEAGTDEREGGASREDVTGRAVAAAVAAQWRTLHGTAPGRRELARIARDADEALSDGDSAEWLVGQVAPFMAARRYLDLARARTHRDCPPPAPQAGSGSPGTPRQVRRQFVGSGL